MKDNRFKLVAPYKPTGDQPEAIEKLKAVIDDMEEKGEI